MSAAALVLDAPVEPPPPARTVARASRRRLTVHKFGGAALADAAAVRRAASLVAADANGGHVPRAVVVASAMAGVTDALLGVAHLAPTATPAQSDAAIARIEARHLSAVDALVADELIAEGAAAELRDTIRAAFAELGALAAAARVVGSVGARELDLVVARGERLAARLLAAVLDRSGVSAAFVDATCAVVTDGRFGHAAPDLPATTRAAHAALRPLLARGVVPVVPGFVGRGPKGEVVTLGRGGSDLTATLLARALGAERVLLWKDVPGLLTADPRVVANARVIPQLHVREAAEVAHYGAKVLHPGALVPLEARTRAFVRPFADPASSGTEISARAVQSQSPVKAIAATMDQALVSVAGRGLFARPGIVARAFVALHEAGLGAALISQAATEYAFAFTVANAQAASAVEALEAALAPELALGEIESVDTRLGVATIGVVGLRLADEPGVAARVFGALATARVNVLAAAQGSGSGGSLSLVVDATRAVEAQQAIHEQFQLHKKGGGRAAAVTHVDVVLLGAGTIGRELLRQIGDRARSAVAGTPLRVCGVIDSTGYVFDGAGLSRRRLASLAAHKAAGGSLAHVTGGRAATAAEAIEAISAHALSRPILVDATAADTASALELALARGWDLVLANKVPLAAARDAAERLQRVAHEHGRRVLHEATVGAGLPVIDTLRKLIEAGDRVLSIEGCPSGTLGYLFGELGRGRSFSAALRSAVAAGYTEPDPRIDLSGLDVARKSLILGRIIGFGGDLTDVAVESLVPPHLRDVPRDEFLARLDELDAAWEARVQAARAGGKVLRYRARVTPRGITVGLVGVAVTDPLGSLGGTDNQFAFTTARYRTQPLVITGPGAGPAVTAAGVVNDLLQLSALGTRLSATAQ